MNLDVLRRDIAGIQIDTTTTDVEKAARRQALLSGKWMPGDGETREEAK